jgi:hypothetical protein
MKKILILGLLLQGSILMYSQIGINTSNPQTILHVDGAKDNPLTGVPSAIEQSNDVVITDTGNIGAGTMTPTEKLDVKGNVQFDGTLKPNGNTGITGQVLTSQGAGNSPTWVSTNIVPVVATVKSTNTLWFGHNTQNQLTFNVIEQDTFGGVDTNFSMITIKQEGDYLIQAQFGYAGGQIYNNGIYIALHVNNGANPLQVMQAPPGGNNNTLVNLVGIHHFVAGDILTLKGLQSNGDSRQWYPSYFRFSVAKM